MKTIVVNLSVANIPENAQPEGVLPCPRLNFFAGNNVFEPITSTGLHTVSLTAEDNDKVGLDAFIWNDNILTRTGTPFVGSETRTTGDLKDQVKVQIDLSEPTTYDINVDIVKE